MSTDTLGTNVPASPEATSHRGLRLIVGDAAPLQQPPPSLRRGPTGRSRNVALLLLDLEDERSTIAVNIVRPAIG